MNLPFFKFYPRDWMGDTQLRIVSIAARGLWFECLCIMHSAKRRGYLETQLGQPINDKMLARLSGTFKDDLYRLKEELLSNGIPSIERSTGIWFNRRMVKDTEKSDKCADAGKRGGGNPTLSTQSPSHSLSNTDSREERTDNQIPDTRSHISLKVPFKGEFKGDSIEKRFSKPTVEQCIENGKLIDLPKEECESFFYHYESKGWIVGKLPMKSWKGAMQTWKRSPFRKDNPVYGSKNAHTPGFTHPNAVRAQQTYCNGEFIPVGGDADVCEQA